MKKNLFILLLLILSFTLFSYGSVETIEYKGSIASLGSSLYLNENYIPKFLSIYTASLNPAPINNLFSLQLNSKILYNFDKRYFDILMGYDFLYYPFKKIIALKFIYDFSMGILCLNNYTHLIEIGVNFDIPLIREHCLYIDSTLYLRQSWKVLNYFYPEEYYQFNIGQQFSVGYRMFY